jgi:transcriptional regulator with XRE-family HTH domain
LATGLQSGITENGRCFVGKQTGKETLGERLARLRHAADLTQVQLAERAGESVSSLRNWEGDHRTPGLWAALQLARVLGVALEELAECAEPGPKKAKEGRKKRKRREGERAMGRPKRNGQNKVVSTE